MIDLGLSVGQVQNRILGFAALKVFAIPARFWYLLSAELLLVLRLDAPPKKRKLTEV